MSNEKQENTTTDPQIRSMSINSPEYQEVIELHDLWTPGQTSTEKIKNINVSSGGHSHAKAIFIHTSSPNGSPTLPANPPLGAETLTLNGSNFTGEIYAGTAYSDIESPVDSRCHHPGLFNFASYLVVWRGNDGSTWLNRTDTKVYFYYENCIVLPGPNEIYELPGESVGSPLFHLVIRKEDEKFDTLKARVVTQSDLDNEYQTPITMVSPSSDEAVSDGNVLYAKFALYGANNILTTAAASNIGAIKQKVERPVFLIVRRSKNSTDEPRRHIQPFFLYRHA